MHALLRKRSTLFLLLVLVVVAVLFAVKMYTGAVERNGTRTVAAQFGFALHELQETSPGIERVETFFQRLKAIDTRKAAPEVQQALRDYIIALQPSLEAARASHPIASYDQAIAQAEQRLTDAVREND